MRPQPSSCEATALTTAAPVLQDFAIVYDPLFALTLTNNHYVRCSLKFAPTWIEKAAITH